jgi:hypothetical protein
MDRTTLMLRLGVVAAALLALPGWRLPGGGGPRPALEVRDQSASMGRSAARGEAAPNTEWVAVADGVRWVPAGGRLDGLPRGASRVGAALADVARRRPGLDVELVSDGRFTDDAVAGARAVRAAGGRVFTRAPVPPAADVGLVRARLARTPAGLGIEVRAHLAASVTGAVQVRLLRQTRVVAQLEVAVQPDVEQEVVLTDPDAPSEASTYLLRLDALPGTPNDDPGNDLIALGLAPERASVRIWGELSLESLRSGERGPEVTRLPSSDAGEVSVADLGAADLVVLAGLPWEAIGASGTESLARFVAEGGRLLVLGGPMAYGPGGWGGTPFEEALAPLRVRPAPPDAVAIVLALDVSGSTAGPAWAALKRAARDALAGLRPGERLAVVPFRGAGTAAALPPGFVAAEDVEGRARLERALEELAPGGATDIPSGIAGALKVLESAGATGERRLLLLTDGDPDDRLDDARLAPLAPLLAAGPVRFAALVVGMPQAVDALRARLAERPEDVLLLAGPEALASRLLAQLARQRARSESERLGPPQGLDVSPGTWAELLPREGPWSWLHDVEAAPGADVVATARLAPPRGGSGAFAAERAHGAGRVHALAWGPGAEGDLVVAARRLAPVVARLASAADRGVSADLDAAGRLRVALPQQLGQGRLTLVLDAGTLALLEVAPGLFESESPVPESSHVRVRGPGLERVLRVAARPPAEHRGVGVDRDRLGAVAAAGGGRLLGPEEAAPRAGRPPGLPLAPYLLLLAAILLGIERWRVWRPPTTAVQEPA